MKIIISMTVLFLFSVVSCNTTDPKLEPELLLKLEDVSCTEAWLQLTTNNIQLPATINLLKNNSVAQVFNLNTQDSLLYINSLLPNQNYSFQVSSIQHPASSNKVTATTLDTTSHNFSWQTFEFGKHSSSTLYDVALINGNDIWAVGEIYLNDSLGNPDSKRYNAIKWNGTNWTVIRIPYNYQGADFYNPIQSVFAFGPNDIWFCGNGVIHWDGNNFNPMPIPTNVWGPYQMNKIWGNSSNNLYIVGNNGIIAHYQNGIWSKIESGTDVNLIDIYGTPNGEAVWVSGYEDFKPTVLLKIFNSRIETVFNSRDYLFVFDPVNLSGGIEGVWTINNNFIYVTTWYSLYRKSVNSVSSNAEALRPGSIVTAFGSKSRGSDINNIFTVGYRNSIYHFNGITFRTYQEAADDKVIYYSLDVKTNLSVLCGQKYENGITDKAIITLIK
jgi:hypothetical protein